MKEIKAIIRPNRLHKIRESVRHLHGFPGMTVSHVEGCSGHSAVEKPDTLKQELTDFTKKVRIEIVAPDELVDEIVRCIHEAAFTGQTGDGVVWVTECSDFRRLCKTAAQQ